LTDQGLAVVVTAVVVTAMVGRRQGRLLLF
jgi:hypothetical protein